MPRLRSSRLTLLPYDVLHQILSLVLSSLPSTVHLNIDSCPLYLKLFRTSEITPCPPILLVCRLLTRHALPMIYAEARIVVHPDRALLKKLSTLRARKYIQHIDLAVELKPRQTHADRSKEIPYPHNLRLESFYSPSYLVDLILRTFPKLCTIHLTIIETVPLGSPNKIRHPRTTSADYGAANGVLHQFSPASLTQSNSIDTTTWNDRIISLRYKTSQAFTDLSNEALARDSNRPPLPLPSPATFPFGRGDPTNGLTGNEIWRNRTRDLMQIASRYTNTTSPTEASTPSPNAPVSETAEINPIPAELGVSTGNLVTDFILEDANDDEAASQSASTPHDPVVAGISADDPSPSFFSSSSAVQQQQQQQRRRRRPHQQHPNFRNFSFPFTYTPPPPTHTSSLPLNTNTSPSPSPSTLSRQMIEAFNRVLQPPNTTTTTTTTTTCLKTHLTTHFLPFTPTTLPSLTSVTIYTTTESSRLKILNNNSAPSSLHRYFPTGLSDGGALAPKFEVLFSDELFGPLVQEGGVVVRRVVEVEVDSRCEAGGGDGGGGGGREGDGKKLVACGWEGMRERDLEMIFSRGR